MEKSVRVKDHTKLKEPFLASGVPAQRVFVPMLFPSQNEWIRMAGSTHTPGANHQRGSDAQSLKNSMENKIQVHLRLANLKPMDGAYFFFTFYELGRQRNKDNIQALALKFFFDAMQKQRILANDGWKEVVGWDPHFQVTKEAAGMEVRMYDPFQCEAQILNETSLQIKRKLEQYKDFRKRTGR
jgi:hypothetical protein